MRIVRLQILQEKIYITCVSELCIFYWNARILYLFILYPLFNIYNIIVLIIAPNRRAIDLILYVWFFWGIILPIREFSTHMESHHYRWKAINLDICSVILAIEQWGFFSVPNLLWHGGIRLYIFNGHLREEPAVER